MRLPVAPMPAARPRGKRGQKAYYPARYAAWLDTMSKLLAAHWRKEPYAGRVRVEAVFHPKSVEVNVIPTEAGRWGRADIDNLAKGLLDSLTAAGVLGDDRQVVELTARFGEEER